MLGQTDINVRDFTVRGAIYITIRVSPSMRQRYIRLGLPVVTLHYSPRHKQGHKMAIVEHLMSKRQPLEQDPGKPELIVGKDKVQEKATYL